MTGDCTEANVCPVEGGFLSYQPSIPGNSVILAAYAAIIPIALVLGYRFRTLGFAVNLATGLCLEVLGFAGRLLLNGRRASQSFFSLYLLGTILGPSLIASAIFVVLPHVLLIYGAGVSPLRSGHAGLFFMALVVLSVVLEIVGVAFAVFGLDGEVVTQSARVLVAGLAVQMFSLLLFVGIYVWFALRLKSLGADLDAQHGEVYHSARFKRFLIVTQSAVTLLLISTIVRIAEVAEGFDSPLSQNEAASTIIYGVLPLLACILLTAFHPGLAFGPTWSKTNPRYVSRLASNLEARPSTNGSFQQRRLESNSHSKFSVRKVAPMPLSPDSPNPYELFHSPVSAGHPSPLRASYNSKSPRRFSYTSRSPGHSPKNSPRHSPRKPPERQLVDDDDLW